MTAMNAAMPSARNDARSGAVESALALRAGDVAPAFVALDARGQLLDAATHWARQDLALFFLRYLGCPLCQSALAKLNRRTVEIAARGAQTWVVIQSSPARCRDFLDALVQAGREAPYTLIPDTDRALYALYGVTPDAMLLNTVRALSIAAVARVASAAVRHGHGVFEGDERQQFGQFVVNRQGRLLHARVASGLADDIDVDAVLNVLPDPDARTRHAHR